MDRPQFLQRIVEWLRAGYPDGVPQGDYIPLVALLRRQLTEDEVQEVSVDLIAESPPPPEPISKIDAAVRITKVTHELPHEADIARVRSHLEASGWPFDDSPLTSATPDNPSTDLGDPPTATDDPSSGRDETDEPDGDES
ncbi:DUF3349 domain-containing protein [Gordonia hankookensis]|uniref:DUF3349 domain-containing protein n=1 Tax=Gordonia hankookensis TaxID=589403 RepID=A0ABR7W862_9ACTN|nr:DUF3349 domain-containing protein [Gordonia hankookensis]MBD1319011.1 DUF3349 domain-containing protein [Gordonia hankookensis]